MLNEEESWEPKLPGTRKPFRFGASIVPLCRECEELFKVVGPVSQKWKGNQ